MPPAKDEGSLVKASAAAAFALIAPALLRGEGLLATAALWRVPPWNHVLAARPGAGLLADQLLQLAPWRQFLHEELLAGHFPLWNPFILGGVPFAGCIQAAPFHPLSWGLFWLSAVPYSLVAAFLKLFCAGLFTGLHLRRLGASHQGATLGAVVFALGGFMTAWLGHPHANVACLLPALFWALGTLADAPSARAAAALALIAGLALLGGHPPTMVHVFAAAGAYAVFLGVRLPPRSRARFAGFALAAALLGACLAAPALLPYLEYRGLSSSAAASAALGRWGTRLSPWEALHLLMPLASGSPALGGEVLAGLFGYGPADNFIERAAWTGLIPLAFALLAVVARRRNREVLFHAVLALAGLAGALGVWPLPALWKLLPGLCEVNPTRLLLFWSFGIATLAGLGVESSPADLAPAPRRAFAWALWLPPVLAGLLYWAKVWASLDELRLGETAFAVGVVSLLALESAAVLRLLAPKRRAWASGLAAVFCLIPALGVNPAAPASTFYPEIPALAQLKAAAGEGRAFALGRALEPDTGMPARLRDARGRDFTTPRRYEELVAGRAGDFDFYAGAEALPPNPALLAIGAAAVTEKTVAAVPRGWTKVHEGALQVFRSPAPARRALFVSSAHVGTPEETLAAARALGFDPSREVLFDDGPAASFPPAKGRARVASDEANTVTVEVEADGPGWLVLLDGWFPGWEADGKEVRRADYAFRAVEVPAGKSIVRFKYRPRSVRRGLMLCSCALVALVFAALL